MALGVGKVENVGVEGHVEQKEPGEPHKDELDDVQLAEVGRSLPGRRPRREEVVHSQRQDGKLGTTPHSQPKTPHFPPTRGVSTPVAVAVGQLVVGVGL